MLCRIVLEGPLFEQYFKKVEVSNFEVASDAFTTFKVQAELRNPPNVINSLEKVITVKIAKVWRAF